MSETENVCPYDLVCESFTDKKREYHSHLFMEELCCLMEKHGVTEIEVREKTFGYDSTVPDMYINFDDYTTPVIFSDTLIDACNIRKYITKKRE